MELHGLPVTEGGISGKNMKKTKQTQFEIGASGWYKV
jgi:hypothetical protein